MFRPLPHMAFAVVRLSCSSAFAQSDTATVFGRITDQSGEVLISAQVSATNVGTGISVSTLTNDDGVYVLPNLRPGSYRLIVEKEGLRKIELAGLILEVQDAVGRNLTMQVSVANESIRVTASRDEQNLSPAVSTVVNQQFVENMPLNGRSFQPLIYMTPGVVLATASAATRTISWSTA